MDAAIVTKPAPTLPLDQRIAGATAYVALSNAHDVAAILPMLAPTAEYSSSRIGNHHGPDAIAAIMTAFFGRYPDVNWAIDPLGPYGDDGVEFSFVMRATDGETGERIERRGIERIRFRADGKIESIEVLA